MNIIKHELKNSLTTIIFYTFSITLMLVLFSTLYPSLKDSLLLYLKDIPPQLAQILNIKLFTTFEGYYAYISIYFALALFILASIEALNVFHKEQNQKTIDFIFSKPIARNKIIVAKITKSLLVITITWLLITVLSTLLLLLLIDLNVTLLILLNLGIYLNTIISFIFALVISIILKQIKHVNILATTISFIYLIIYYTKDLLNITLITYLSPLNYFKSADIYLERNISFSSIFSLIICLLITIKLLTKLFSYKDLI